MKQTSSSDDYATVAAADLLALEHGLDDTLGRASQLLLTLASGRPRSGLAAAAGQAGAEELGLAINSMIEARGRVVAAHRKLGRDAKAFGLQWRLAGPLERKPDEPIVERPSGRQTGQAVT